MARQPRIVAPTTSQRIPQPVGNEPNVLSTDYNAMLPYWNMIDAILGGAETIRAAGELYLPRFVEERRNTKDTAGKGYDPYEVRRRNAPFTNIYDDISRSLSSKPFAKDVRVDPKEPQRYQDFAQDIDGQGNSLHVFGSELFKSGVDYAISWILVEYSKAIPNQDGSPLSRAQEQAQGLRPYWVLIPAKRMLAVYSDYVGGTEVIYHARIDEPTIILDGFIERTVNRVRVMQREPVAFDTAGKPAAYGPAVWAVYEEVVAPQTNTRSWELVDFGVYTIGMIPLVPFITGRRRSGTWQIEPPLKGLAHLQIYEYQQENALQNIIQMTCFPMLAGQGVKAPDDRNIAVGPRTVLYAEPNASGQAGNWAIVEPGAQSIRMVADRLKQTQDDMRDLGMQPLTMQNLTVITTGQVAIKANSTAQFWAIKFKDALEQAFMFTAAWMGEPNAAPSVDVYTDFSVALDDGKGFQAAFQLRQNKDLSRDNVLAVAVRYGYLPDDFDYDENEQELADEQQGLVAEQQINPLTGMPLDIPLPGQKAPGPPPPPRRANGNGQQQPPPQLPEQQ